MTTIIFKNGDQGDNVLSLQKFLNAKGAKPALGEDGKLGPLSAGQTGVYLSNSTGIPFDSSLLTLTPIIPVNPSGSTVLGLDLYQDTIDSWAKIFAAGYRYGWIKSSDGASSRVQFATYFPAAKAAGFKIGPYHFYQPGVSVQTQINVLLAQMQKTTWKAGIDLMPTLDFETFSASDPTATDYANANAFLKGLQQAAGVKVVIYGSDSVITNAPLWIDGDLVWDARYGSKPKYPQWTFFQNSENTAIPGINGGAPATDADIFNGSYADLQALIAASVI